MITDVRWYYRDDCLMIQIVSSTGCIERPATDVEAFLIESKKDTARRKE